MRIDGSSPNGYHGLPGWTKEANALWFEVDRALADYRWENCDHGVSWLRCSCATDFLAIAMSLASNAEECNDYRAAYLTANQTIGILDDRLRILKDRAEKAETALWALKDNTAYIEYAHVREAVDGALIGTPAPREEMRCTGTLVHSEFDICPVHDRRS